MRRALPLLLLLPLSGAARAQAAEERASLETVVARDWCFVGEPVRVGLRLRFDRRFFAESAVQMFQRELDLPVQVSAPWLRKLEGAVMRAGEEPQRGESFALNGEMAVRPAEGDARFGLITVERVFVPLRPGEFVLEEPSLRFTYGTRFKEDFFGGRVALDPQDAVVSGETVTLRVEPLPEAGRPQGFAGPVGRISVSADAAPRELEVGASLGVVLRIDGDGNLASLAAPRLDGLAGFHCYGLTDDEDPSHRTIRYELVPLDANVTEVPSITAPWFDPEGRAYRTARTEPIPIRVRARPGTVEPSSEEAAEVRSPWLPAGVLAAVAAAALALWLRARRRRARAPDPAAVFRARAARAGVDLAELFAEFLAAHLHCPTASVITPDLGTRLRAAGTSEAIAARAARLVESLVAARYGGMPPGDDALAEAHALVDALSRNVAGSAAADPDRA